MSWHCTEIHELCNRKNLFYPVSYLKSLDWINRKVEYHARQARKAWDDFKSAHPGGEVGGSNEEWWETFDASAAETEAVVQSLNSQADIVAQVLNKLVLRESLPQRQVTFSKVLEQLEEMHELASNITVRMCALKDSREFKYIKAFCNTIKHERLIDRQWHIEGGEGTRNEEDVRFLEFSYKGESWPITWASDINVDYRKILQKYLKEIGVAIIDYLSL